MATFDDDMNYNPNSPPTGESTVDDITGTDDDLMLLDQEDRIQLAIAATLKRRINGVPTRSDGHEHERKVSSTAEAVLKEMLKTLAHRGTPVTPNFVNDYASVLAGAPVGETYAKRFLARHPDLAVKFANPLEELEASQARELLADKENGRLREALFAKKNKPKRGKFSTAHARLMTSDEMVGALLLEFQKKLMAELHKGMKTALAAAKKKVVDEEKRLREEKKQAEKAARPARGRGRGRGTGGRGAGGRGAGGRGRGSGRGGRGGGTRSRRRHADEDSDDETPSPSESEGCASDDTASSPDTEDPTPRRRGTRLRSQAAAQDEATVSDLPASEGDEDIDSNGDEDVDLEEEEASEVELEAERSDIESDGEETGVLAVNGHRWRDGNVEFQVLWEDGDCTWEPLATVDDCAALDDYLAGRDVEDALRLPKRQYRINTQLELTHP
ncbi:DDE-domain-containing protein [Mycena kentingensis (nom. inval.)]|nr:DDE-domain-containing protein [Mycena kentingensis (nom. inval.)]